MDILFSFTKHIHVWCVTGSFGLFILRAMWHASKSDKLSGRTIRIAPHVVDTLLLISGLVLMYLSSYFDTLPSWLAIKFSTLVLYIVFGIIAFQIPKVRTPALILALLAFLATSYLAINKPL